MSGSPRGTFCLVLHSHLPWLLHHGAWPVGEEWVHQALAASYSPVVAVLEELAAEGRRDLLTLGVTPVLAQQLDDPWLLREHHTWLSGWQLRAEAAADPALRAREVGLATAALRRFEARWAHGASPVLRGLADDGVVELLGGPLTHPFTPLLDERVALALWRSGLADGALRRGRPTPGAWLPECATRPGLELLLARAGVERLVLDGPALHGQTAAARPLGGSGVVAFPRDLEVTYRVWSPRAGYPGGRWYRDFHTFDHDSGLHPARVTGSHVAPEHKAPYDEERAAAAVERDARDFVDTVVRRLDGYVGAGHPPGRALVVAAYDTELLGHWWHEGPAWLARVLRLLPEAGVRVTTLTGAVEAGCVGEPVDPEDVGRTSWGAGKDWHVWDGDPVRDLVHAHDALQARVLHVLAATHPRAVRSDAHDQLARELALALASDWAFLVSHGSSPDYARRRADGHARAAHRLADALEAGDAHAVERRVARSRAADGPPGVLDSRSLLP